VRVTSPWSAVLFAADGGIPRTNGAGGVGTGGTGGVDVAGAGSADAAEAGGPGNAGAGWERCYPFIEYTHLGGAGC
jgi:hypothetical protein